MTISRTRRALLAIPLVAALLITFTPTPAKAAGEQFNISASEGRPGMTGLFTQDDPCPSFVEGPGVWQVVEFTFTDAAGTAFNVRDSHGTRPDGTWLGGINFTVPYRSLPTPYAPAPWASEAAQGMGSFVGRCVLHPGGTVVQEYAPQPFNVTGTTSTFSFTPTMVMPSANITVTGVDPCPGQVEVTIRDSMYARTTEPLVVPDANGAWSVTLPASQLQWDGSPDVPFSPGAGTVSAACVTEPNGRYVFHYADEALTIGGGTTPPPTSNCKDVLFIGVSGSGEPSGHPDNVAASPSVATAYEAFKGRLTAAGNTHKVRMVEYPALPVATIWKYAPNINKGLREYLEGKNTGVRKLRNLVEQQLTNCPNQLLVPVGYSQGALVVHEYLVEHARTYTGAKKQAIAAAVTIADPAQIVGSDVFNFEDSGSDAMGICQYTSVNCFRTETFGDIPAAYTNRTTTVCKQNDAVCDHFDVVNPLPFIEVQGGIATHLSYDDDAEVVMAGKRAANRVNNRLN